MISFAATMPIPRPLKRAGAIPSISTPLDLAQSTNWVCCSPGSSAAVMAAVDDADSLKAESTPLILTLTSVRTVDVSLVETVNYRTEGSFQKRIHSILI